MRRLNNYILCVVVSVLLFFAAAGTEGMYLLKNKVLEPSVYHDILEKMMFTARFIQRYRNILKERKMPQVFLLKYIWMR